MNSKLQFLFARRSVRVYRSEPIGEALIHDLLSAAMAAPSAVAKDPWLFIVIRQPETLAAIAEGLPNGQMLASAPLGLAVCGDLRRAQGGELSYLLQDCSAAIENLLLAAHALGLGACWLGVHPRPERMAHLRSLLNIPEPVIPVAMLAVGWPAEYPEPRTRYREDAVFFERFRGGADR